MSDDGVDAKAKKIDVKLGFGLGLLKRASLLAEDANAPLWDFALEINQLYKIGLTVSDIRWLVAKKFVQHGVETSANGDCHRSFLQKDGLKFESTTCLVLTKLGGEWAENLASNGIETPTLVAPINSASNDENDRSSTVNPPRPSSEATLAPLLKPRWCLDQRELWLDQTIVKRYRVPARNQQAILCAFEEEDWPEHIDDPLTVNLDIDPQTRLHDTINRLNGCQTHPLLRFHGNGLGTGVRWEIRGDA